MNKKIIILLFLSLYIFFIYKCNNKPYCINKNINDNNIQNHYDFLNDKKIYNNTESTFISIIFDYTKIKCNIENLIDKIFIFFQRTCDEYNDIKFYLIWNYSRKININEISAHYSSAKNLSLYSFENNYINIIFDIINQMNSKYLLFVNKFIELENIDLYKIYDMTKGSINNIFKYYINNTDYFYLFRMKILMDIIDEKIKFNNLEDLIIYINSLKLPKLNYIPISFTPSNKYTPFAYTSMISILSTKSFNTYILFFVITSRNYTKHNKSFLESLYSQYDYFNITFIIIGDKYKNAFTARYLTIHAYFRYSLGELLPQLNKIIYLDPDTLTFGDLSQLYSLNFRGKVMLGRIVKSIKINGKNYFSINTGILLLNLKEMRKMKLEQKILNIINSGFGHKNITKSKEYNIGTDIHTLDQAIINLYFYKNIGLLPPKYNAIRYNYKELVCYNNNTGNRYEKDFLYFSIKFPIIKHYPGSSKNWLFHVEEWIYYAKKSKYFNIISNNLSNIYNYSSCYF